MPDNPHLSPAQDLPSDILEQILTLVANSAKDSDDPLQALRCFTAVNHHWNHVSYSCTPLWQNLGHIRVDLHNCRPESASELLISSLEDRFERARSQPVTFTFNVAPTLAYGRPRDIQLVIERAFAVLARYSAQWENVGFSLPAAHVYFLNSVAGKLPLLERISMEVLHPDVPVRLDQFAIAPRLRHASFRFPGKYGVDVRDKIHLPWSQLLSYHEDIFPQDVGFHLALVGSPKLQSLICSFPFTSINYSIAVPVQHSTLTRLHLKFTASNSTILRRLIIPSLEDLSVVSSGVDTIFPDIMALIQQSHCVIRSLAILPDCASYTNQGGALTRVLNICPELHSLTVNSIPPQDLENLTRPNGTGSGLVVPSLRRLILCYTSSFPITPQDDYYALRDLACAREEMRRKPLELSIEIAPSFQGEVSWLKVIGQLEGFSTRHHVGSPAGKVGRWVHTLGILLDEGRNVAEVRTEDSSPSILRESISGLQLLKVAREMEAYELNRGNIGLLYHREVPLLLERIASLPPETFPLEKVFDLSAWTKALFRKWKSLLIEDARVNGRWMRRGKHTVEFIGRESERREDDDLVWEMVVGAPETPRTRAEWLEVGIWL
ncbi:hypothetical protein D9611_010936 [Ephemerocybe angulata]|uniref:F-box domain-containing protein n=1 Tax=Ephemerocybe angulata TaxID=980116 RepID=A0A8H5C4Q2_9AGAR|nr:hypothetical protein D9611_010936 [Tulosesus angulatus]